jgi:restriction system protein
MGRAKGNRIENLATLPWSAGVVFGVSAFFAIRDLLPMLVKGNSFAPIVAALHVPMSWLMLVVGLIGAAMSWAQQRHRRRLLDAQQGLESIAALGWRHFEQLVGEAFRRQGHNVEETGLGGADGGIDLILRKNGRRVLVQCKQWRRRQIPVNVVREMYGLLAHHGANEVKIACSGTYTRDAEEFAKDKPIELIGGQELLRMVREVQTTPVQTTRAVKLVEPAATASAPTTLPVCPKCGKPMIERSNRATGQKFWGCSKFPVCRGVR